MLSASASAAVRHLRDFVGFGRVQHAQAGVAGQNVVDRRHSGQFQFGLPTAIGWALAAVEPIVFLKYSSVPVHQITPHTMHKDYASLLVTFHWFDLA